MKPIDMRKFGGHKASGRDYSVALRDMLPQIIATEAKSRFEIAAAAQRDHESVRRVMAKLRDQVHIAGWRRGKCGPIEALWLWGPGEDAPYPGPMSSAEKSRKYRATERGSMVNRAAARNWYNSEAGKQYRMEDAIRKKARRRIMKAAVERAYLEIKSRDPLLAAIMGRK